MASNLLITTRRDETDPFLFLVFYYAWKRDAWEPGVLRRTKFVMKKGIERTAASMPIVLYGMQYRSRTRADRCARWILDLHSLSSRTMHRGPFCLSVNTEGIDGRRSSWQAANGQLTTVAYSVHFPPVRSIDTSIIDVNRSRVSTSPPPLLELFLFVLLFAFIFAITYPRSCSRSSPCSSVFRTNRIFVRKISFPIDKDLRSLCLFFGNFVSITEDMIANYTVHSFYLYSRLTNLPIYSLFARSFHNFGTKTSIGIR